MRGFILLHRSVMDHWVWLSDKHFKRWIDLIFMASWEDKTIEYPKFTVHLKRGQFITSLRKLQNRWNTNASTVMKFLKTLQSCKMITQRKRHDMTIITILNYDKFQSEKFWEDSTDEIPQKVDAVSTEIVTQNLEPEIEKCENGQERNREQTEINKINNKLNSSVSLREREENLFEELKKAEIFFDEVAKNFSVTKKEAHSWLEKFKSEMMALEKWHTDFKDLRQHFYNWLRIQIEKQKQYGTRKKSGSENNGGSSPDRYAARRGTDVGNKKSTDYGGSF